MKRILIIFIVCLCSLSGSGSNGGYFYQPIRGEAEEPPVSHFNFMEHYKNLSLENLTCWHEGVFYTEEWRNIKGWESYYMGSSFGRFKSLQRTCNTKGGAQKIKKEQILKQGQRDGYLHIHFQFLKKGITTSAHRLIAKSFIENGFNKPQVNHKDGIRSNNFFKNLEWSTQSENVIHALKTGLRKMKIGIDSPNSIQVNAVNIITGESINYGSIKDALITLGKSPDATQSITWCCIGKRKTAYGHYWSRL
jgi:hypothetical protein